MTSRAPIALFIYNRPDHLQRTLNDLLKCDGFDKSPIFVFADGPKNPDQTPLIDATRVVAKKMLGDRAVYRFAERNKGLANSIIDGVNELTDKYGKVIVIEDDLGLAPQFLTYMNAALARYEHDENIYQVSGHMFNVSELREAITAVILPLTTTWGWATWRRAWLQFDRECKGWEHLSREKQLRRKFNLDGAYDYATMLERQMRRGVDSWGIKWYWSVFRKSGLTVFPPQSLVGNNGVDGSGSHGRGVVRSFGSNLTTSTTVPALPEPVPNSAITKAVFRAVYRQNGGIRGRAVDILKRFLR